MSYILEALKKKDSDQEKDVPDLASHHYQGDFVEESNSNNKLLLWAFAVLVLLLTLFMMYKLGQSKSTSDSIPLVSAAAKQNTETVKLNAEAIETTKTEPKLAKNNTQKNQVVKEASSMKIESAPIEVKEPVVEKIKYVAPKVEQVAALPVEIIEQSSAGIPEENISTDPLNNNGNVSSELVSETNTDSNFSALPSLRYNTHVYADSPSDRFISLNGKTYGVGEKLSNGIKIKDILEDDLLIVYRGKTYKIPSLTDINQ